MRKYFCDRCGEEIKLAENGALDNAIPADGKELRLEMSERRIKRIIKDKSKVPETVSDEWRDIQFCKKCTEQFYDFVNGLEVKNIWKPKKKENAE